MREVTDDADHDGDSVDPDHEAHTDADHDSNHHAGGEPEGEGEPFETQADDSQIIAVARRRHGTLGGVVAAGMLGLDKVLGRKPREEIPVVVVAPTEPIDVDADGITVPLDEQTDIVSPPLPRTAPKVAPTCRRRR